MATSQASTASHGADVLLYAALLALLVGLLVAVSALLTGLSPTAIAEGTASVGPLVWAGLLAGGLGATFLGAVGLALSLC